MCVRPAGEIVARRTQTSRRDFQRAVRRRAKISDLSADNLNRFLLELAEAHQSPYTLKNRRTGLLVLWRHASRLGVLAEGPDKVRTVHCPELDVEGYTVEQMEQLLATAKSIRGTIRGTGIRASVYWGSLILTKWDLGLRAGDVLAIPTQHYKPAGRLWVFEHKTRKSGWHKLRPSTSEAIAACIAVEPGREFIWPGIKQRSFYRAFGNIAAAAGLPGTSRWLRSGSGSAVEKAHPGSGWRFLNHSTPSVFEKHYRVDAICQSETIMPPEIGTNAGPSQAKGGAA